MSLLGDFAKQALGGVLGESNQGQAGESPLLHMATGLLQQIGGVDGLVAKFQQAGLGEKIASWIGTGHNLPVSVDQIKQVLGGHLDELARQTGRSQDDVAGGLAQILPGLIDHITPNGEVPHESTIQKMLGGLLQNGGLAKLLGNTSQSA